MASGGGRVWKKAVAIRDNMEVSADRKGGRGRSSPFGM